MDSGQVLAGPNANSGRLSDVAYSRILELLFERRLPAGAFVSQNDLVNLLGIPVAPLRDALKILETEGVLTIHPRSGIQFVKPGLELTRSTYQFRGILERAAVAIYTETAEDSELDEIERRHLALIARIDQFIQRGAEKTEILALNQIKAQLQGIARGEEPKTVATIPASAQHCCNSFNASASTETTTLPCASPNQ